jgi:hypothetical protein
MYKDKDSNWRNYFKININIIYTSYNREKTLLAFLQVKGKGKAQLNTIRLTSLFGNPSRFNSPLIILTSDLLEEVEYNSNNVLIKKERA